MRRGGEKQVLILAFMLLAAASLPGAAAHASGSEGGAQLAAGNVQSAVAGKMRLVKLLFDQSPAVQRIPQSGNVQARNLLADARSAYERAGAEVQGGRLDAATSLLDQALRQIVEASRLVPDPVRQAAQDKARYAQLSEAIGSFRTLYQGAAARTPKLAAFAPDLERIGSMTERAAALAAAGNHPQANGVLAEAYKIVVSVLNKTLASETIVYDAKFDNPADEFKYELARNGGYDELVPVAQAQLNAPPETAALSDRYVQQSRQLREVARQQAARGEYRVALKTIQDATGHLQRALRAAGLVVPQAAETAPQ